MRTIHAKQVMSDEEVEAHAGKVMDAVPGTIFIGGNDEEVRVLKPDGSTLLHYVPNVIDPKMVASTRAIWRESALLTDNRGMAAGGRVLTRNKNGTMGKRSRTAPVHSGVIGHYDVTATNPYCRLTAWTAAHVAKFRRLHPFIRAVDAVFKRSLPERWEAQMEFVRRTRPEWVIPGTSFTTVTVNKDFRTALHQDKGDLPQGFGVLTAIRSGIYTGGETCFPKYGVGCDMATGCVMLADVHEWHHNTAMTCKPGAIFERISLVFYYRSKMAECGSPENEIQRAVARAAGGKL